MAVIAAAAVAAFANVYGKRHGSHEPLVTLPPAMLASGALVFVAGLCVERTDWHAAVSGTSLAALLYLALLGSGVAFLLLMWLLQRLPAGIVGLCSLTFPVIAIATGALLGGEHVAFREVAGAVLVVAGMAIALLPVQVFQRLAFTGVSRAAS